jgi:HPt (histidine-containing phosphotransfer) domain-containing protein
LIDGLKTMFTPPPRPEPTPINMEQALAALQGNAQLLTTVVQLVIDQSGVDMAVIRSDVAAKNASALAASSHRLKGSLGAIAAVPAYQACSALNKLARTGCATAYAVCLNHLEEEIDRLLPTLQSWLDQNKYQGNEDGKS